MTDPQLERAINRAAGEAVEGTARQWHDEFLPKHFADGASRRYGYAARQGERADRNSRAFRRSYTGRKMREYGHTRALVYKGDSQRLMKVAAFSHRRSGPFIVGTAAMSVPDYYMKHPHRRATGRFIDKPDETTRTIPSEQRQLATGMAARFEAALRPALGAAIKRAAQAR